MVLRERGATREDLKESNAGSVRLGQGVGIVQVQDHAFFLDRYLGDIVCVGPNHLARANPRRSLLQFVEQVPPKNNRMPSPSLVSGESYRRRLEIERLNQRGYEPRGNQRMVRRMVNKCPLRSLEKWIPRQTVLMFYSFPKAIYKCAAFYERNL